MSLSQPITPENIDSWRATVSENERLEFKEAKQNFDSLRLREYCIAIANEGGGYLLCGIQNDPPRKVVGTKIARERFNLPETKSAIVSQIIGNTQDIKLIKPDDTAGGSRKFARYLPFWA